MTRLVVNEYFKDCVLWAMREVDKQFRAEMQAKKDLQDESEDTTQWD